LTALGRLVGRLFTAGFGYIVACVAAGLTISLSIVVQAFIADTITISYQRLLTETLFVAGLTASFATVYAFAPAIVGIIVAEIFRIRRKAYHVLAGGLVGALAYVASFEIEIMQRGGDPGAPELGSQFALYVAAGLIGGFVYWGFAGRTSGAIDRPPA